jgi:hypothetical protein
MDIDTKWVAAGFSFLVALMISLLVEELTIFVIVIAYGAILLVLYVSKRDRPLRCQVFCFTVPWKKLCLIGDYTYSKTRGATTEKDFNLNVVFTWIAPRDGHGSKRRFITRSSISLRFILTTRFKAKLRCCHDKLSAVSYIEAFNQQGCHLSMTRKHV